MTWRVCVQSLEQKTSAAAQTKMALEYDQRLLRRRLAELTAESYRDVTAPGNVRFRPSSRSPTSSESAASSFTGSSYSPSPSDYGQSTSPLQLIVINISSCVIRVPRVGPGHPSSPLSIYFLIFSPFYFFLSFLGFTYFLLLSIPSLSTRIDPLLFQAGGRRRRPNLGLVCFFLCNLCYLYSLVKMDCGVLLYLV